MKLLSNSPHGACSSARGFSLLELCVASAVLLVVVGGAMNYIAVATQRSKVEQTKVDLSQEGREFVDEFERDFHQAGYPGCAAFNNFGVNNCATTANYNNANFAAGLISVSNTNVIFEGDVDGDGVIESVQYRLVDAAGNYPPSTTCPCTLQRSQVPKVTGLTAPTYTQATNFSQELQNVVNSGVPGGTNTYGGGLPIAGNTTFSGGNTTDTAYYAAITTFKDFPVFTAFDQYGNVVPLPLDFTTLSGQQTLATIKSVRITINLLGTAATGYDAKTGVRPVLTLVGDARRNNRMPWEQ